MHRPTRRRAPGATIPTEVRPRLTAASRNKAIVRRDRALHPAFIALELAGQERLEPDLVVLHLEQLELEAFALGKTAARRDPGSMDT